MASKRVVIAGRNCEVQDAHPRVRACTIDFGVRQAPPDDMRDLDVTVAFAPREPVAEGGVSFDVTLGWTRSADDPGQAVLTLRGGGFEIVRGSEYARDVAVPGPVVQKVTGKTAATSEARQSREGQGRIGGKGGFRFNPVDAVKSLVGLGGSDPARIDVEAEAAGNVNRSSSSRDTTVDGGSIAWSEKRERPRAVYDGNGRWRFVEPLPERCLENNYIDTDAAHGLCSVEPTGEPLTMSVTCAVKKRHVRIDDLSIDGKGVADWTVEQLRVMEILAKRGVFADEDDRLVVAAVQVREVGDG